MRELTDAARERVREISFRPIKPRHVENAAVWAYMVGFADGLREQQAIDKIIADQRAAKKTADAKKL